MLLFKKRFHAGLRDGTITVTFRRWRKPHVRTGGRYRVHPIGVVAVSAVEEVRFRDVSAEDARAAGFADVRDLRAHLEAPVKTRDGAIVPPPVGPDTPLFRVALHHAGQEDRLDLALDAELSPEDVEGIAARLRRLDRAGAWTRTTLSLIRRHPQVAASRLAARVGRETAPFKIDVRKLKRLGLTMSFEVGYELSPRGRAFLRARRRW